ncbi:MAG: bifunctional precorrin-2 dehydrogenase/sirohydrochlorin ferrochelatase [Holophagaceae bacterium]
MPTLLPVFLNLHGQPVLLVGAGSVAQARLPALLEAGASLTVVAPAISGAIQGLATGYPRQVRLLRRKVEIADLVGARLVVSATADPWLNGVLAHAAKKLGIWFNAVDVAERCEFHMAGSLRRGPLQVAVGSGGAFPGLVRALRAGLDALLPKEHLDDLERLAELRRRIRAELPDAATRGRILRRAVETLERDYFQALRERLEPTGVLS